MSQHFNRTVHELPGGYSLVIKWFVDEFMGPPWDEHDGHGIVSDWTRRKKGPGERVLVSDRRDQFRRYYDVQATMRIAKRDGWWLSDENIAELKSKLGRDVTPGDIRAAAVDRDFEYLRRWCNDDWHWCSYHMTIRSPDPEGSAEFGSAIHWDSLCGLCSDDIQQTERELIDSATEFVISEMKESEDAACRGTLTATA